MVMTLFHSLIYGVVALCTTQGLRFPCLMMAVRKRPNIVQWSYWRVPLNVVPPIPLLGYPDIDQRHVRQMDGRACTPQIRTFPWGKWESHSARNARISERVRGPARRPQSQSWHRSAIERSALRRQFDRAGRRQMKK